MHGVPKRGERREGVTPGDGRGMESGARAGVDGYRCKEGGVCVAGWISDGSLIDSSCVGRFGPGYLEPRICRTVAPGYVPCTCQFLLICEDAMKSIGGSFWEHREWWVL